MRAGLEQRAGDLLDRAAQAFRGHTRAEAWLRHHRARLGEPLRLAVTGGPRSGKSTLVNALIGEDVAPVAGNAEAVWFHDGTQPLARVFPEAAPPFTAPLERAARRGHTVALPESGIRQVVVEWPCRALRRTRLLETAEEVPAEADAVLHLVRHLGDDDLAPLRAAGAHPVHTLVLLSRADEMAGGRTDALLTAKRIARRRRTDPRTSAVCQDVLAVSARIAHAGRTLREQEYATVVAIAGLPRPDAEPHLLSADRFTGASFPSAIPAGRRADLLARLGLGGVRLAVTLARTTARSRAELGDQLARQSGLTELQASISDLLTTRRGVLKARVALVALEHLLRAEAHPATGHLAAELELLLAGAHELRELRLLAALRTGRVALPGDLALEARRLVGGDGGAHCERLGLDPQTPPEKLWPAAESAAARWHEQTTAAATAAGRRAAEVVLRSCTAILDDLG
ncbi:hypothetical protein [Actinoplanes subtropicus]|uniref:hypothetical protein n=1 Tax=Actinoplanes subtropicus TaxID=543632 RepID=UPI000555BAD9|nr:hypothetical protein [Actinoplanes subtropicus]